MGLLNKASIGDLLTHPLSSLVLLQQATESPITDPIPDQDKLDDLALIEKRLDNWFARQSQSSVRFERNAKKRWESLQKEVDRSHAEFWKLTIAKSSDGVITGCNHQSIHQFNHSINHSINQAIQELIKLKRRKEFVNALRHSYT